MSQTGQTPRRDPPAPGGGAPFFLIAWVVITALLAGTALATARTLEASLVAFANTDGSSDGYPDGSTDDGYTDDGYAEEGSAGAGNSAEGASGAGGWAPESTTGSSADGSAPTFTPSSSSSTSLPSTTSANGLTATGLPGLLAQRTVAETLVDHGEAINSSRYADAWALMSPALQDRSGSLDEWRRGVSSSQWTQLDIYRVTLNGDGTAGVETHLRTTQDPSQGDGYSCLDWSLLYTLTGNGSSWRIDKASGESRPC